MIKIKNKYLIPMIIFIIILAVIIDLIFVMYVWGPTDPCLHKHKQHIKMDGNITIEIPESIVAGDDFDVYMKSTYSSKLKIEVFTDQNIEAVSYPCDYGTHFDFGRFYVPGKLVIFKANKPGKLIMNWVFKDSRNRVVLNKMKIITIKRS